jgi:5'(3')-deoxyribonucleotidase
MKLVIAIDCDDVLIASTEYLVEAYNKQYGTQVTLARAHESDNEEWNAPDSKVVLDRLSQIQMTEQYGLLQPSPEAVAAVRSLAKHHELHLITARDQSVEAVTMSMLNTYLKDCFTTIEHVGHGRPKGEVCRQLGADILVDDNVKHLLSALECGMRPGQALHFGAYPWNDHATLPAGVVQCNDWSSVVAEVDKIAGR